MHKAKNELKIESPFKGRVKARAGKLLDSYEKDNNLSVHKYIKDVFAELGGKDRYKFYLSDTISPIWLKGIPDKFTKTVKTEDDKEEEVPLTTQEVRQLYDKHLMNFMIYCLSIFEIDHYFRNCEKVSGWLPLFVNDKAVHFLEKMLDVFPYERFINTRLRKIQPIFTQFMVMGESIARNIDEARVQADIAGSIVTTATVAGRIKTPDIFSITAR